MPELLGWRYVLQRVVGLAPAGSRLRVEEEPGSLVAGRRYVPVPEWVELAVLGLAGSHRRRGQRGLARRGAPRS